MSDVKIESRIVGWDVVRAEEPERVVAGPDPDVPLGPISRPPALSGVTYKIKTPLSEAALYVTINDIEIGDMKRPFEIFINCKDTAHHQWTVALTRVMSAVFRHGGDPSFLVEELKSVFDPRGGYWKSGEGHVPSLVAEIGVVLDRHLTARFGMGPVEPKRKPCPKCGGETIVQEGCERCSQCQYEKCG